MWDVNLAMLPALVMAIHNFGLRAALVIGFSVAGAVAAGISDSEISAAKPSTLSDGSAVVTGILLAFCVPAALPLWVAFRWRLRRDRPWQAGLWWPRPEYFQPGACRPCRSSRQLAGLYDNLAQTRSGLWHC